MIEVGILKNFDSGTYKAGVQLMGSLTTYFDDISVARNIPSSALVIGNYVILVMPGGNPGDACVIAAWPQGSAGGGGGSKIQDADGDTSWDTEQSADEDKIHGKVKGVEAFLLDSDGVLSLARQSRFQAHKNSNTQTIGNSEAKVTFETEVYDEQGEYDNTTNYRFTAKKAGYYLVMAFVTFSDPQDQDRIYVSLKKNTGTYLSTYWATHSGGSSPGYMSMAPFSIAYLAVNDYVEVYARSWDGNRTIASLTNAQFYGHKLS